MEPMLGNLERSLEANKVKLKEESSLRLELESRWLEKEADNMALRDENNALREECEALGDQLDQKFREAAEFTRTPKGANKDSARSVATSVGDTDTHTGTSTVDDSYGEVLDELEGVTEQLIETQQKLWKAEDKCRESQSRVVVLERALKSLKRLDQEMGGIEAQKSLLDNMEDDESHGSEALDDHDKRSAHELDSVRSDLEEVKRDREATELQTKFTQQEARAAKANRTDAALRAQVAEIDELKAKNAVLVEETNYLREVLEGRNDKEPDDTRTYKQSRELTCLHNKLKTVIKENVSLRQQVERLQRGQTPARNDEVLELKKQVAKLQYSLERAEEENMKSIHDSDFEWYVKLEKLRKDLEEQKVEEMTRFQTDFTRDADAAMHLLQERAERLADDNRDLQDVIDQLESEIRRCQKEHSIGNDQARSSVEHLKEAMDEISSLKKRLAELSIDLDRAERYKESSQEEAKEARLQYADACAELEVARQILDEAGLDHETIVREDERELKREIHSLSKELERSRREYAELENEFLESQHRFCDSQEAASRKTADELDYLNGKVAEMEAALELARADYSDMSVKLEKARKENHLSLRQGKTQGRESTIKALHLRHNSEVNRMPSDDEFEGNDLKKKLGDLVTQLEIVNAELRARKDELEIMTKENRDLKDNLARLEESKERGVQVLDKFFNADGTTGKETRNALDPEEELDSSDSTPSPPVNVPESFFKSPFSWFSRDPPATEKVESLESTLRGEGQITGDSVDLESQLRLLSRENEFLKEKIVSIECSNLIGVKTSSHSVQIESAEVKQMIKELEESLQTNEKNADELERLNQKLLATQRKLASTQMVLEETNDENDDLRAEVRELKAAVSEARQKLQETMAAEHRVEFGDVRDRLNALTNEKAALHRQLDDAKIALSTSQFELESHKEQAHAKETVLAKSKEEIDILRRDLHNISQNLNETKQAYSDAMRELQRGRDADGIHDSSSIRQLSQENYSLQRVVGELRKALALARDAQDSAAVEELELLHEEQNRMLIDEVSRLSDALEVSKCEYNAVVEELEAVCDMFEEARDEAEQNGKEAAMREIRTAMKGSRETERQAIKEQAKTIFEENRSLQRKLNEVELALTQARLFQKCGEEMATVKTEVQVLRQALDAGEEEMRRLKERELTLDLALMETRIELNNTKEELDMIYTSSNDSKQAVEKSARAIAVDEFRSIGHSEELKAVKEKLQEMLDLAETDFRYASSIDDESDQRNEAIRMKIELLDLSMSLEKTMRENAVIEEELEYLRQSTETARKEGEKEGRLRATKELRIELNKQRERETKEFKEKYNALASENGKISRKLRETEIELSLALESRDQSHEEVARMEEELKRVTMKASQLQHDMLDLTIERESNDMESKHEIKPKDLYDEFSAINLENTKLHSQLRNIEAMLVGARKSEEKSKNDVKSLTVSLKEKERKVEELTRISAELKTEYLTTKLAKEALLSEKNELQEGLRNAESSISKAKFVTMNEVGEFEKAFRMSKEENAKLRSQMAQLKETLEASTRELDQLRGQFDKLYKDATSRDSTEAASLREQLNNLVAEKAALQKQVDESKVNLSLQKYTQDRNLEELKVYQDKLLSSKMRSTARFSDQSKAEEEVAQIKEDAKVAMRVLRQASHLLDLVDGVESGPFMVQDTLLGRAEDIKCRVTHVTALLEKARDECSKVNDEVFRLSNELRTQERNTAASETALERIRQAQLRDKMELELSEVKYAEARKEATGYKNEIHRLRSTLENAQKDHASLRGQLEQMNFRVQQMCAEAEARGKAAATAALQAGMGNVSGSERTELMAQFKKFYDENVALQMQLDRHRIIVANLERELREKSDDSATLSSANKRLSKELDLLREDLEQAKSHRTNVLRELAAVKEQVSQMSLTGKKSEEVKPETISSEDSLMSMPPPTSVRADAQFSPRKLSRLAQLNPGVNPDDEHIIVSTTQMPEVTPRKRADTRKMKLLDLQRQVQLAIEESSQRTDEIKYSSSTASAPMYDDHRAPTPEKSRKIHGVSSVLFTTSQQHSNMNSIHTDNAVTGGNEHIYGVMDEDSSIRSDADNANSESREDSQETPTARDMMAAPRPLPRPIPVKESKNLTSRALEAIAQSKKNKYRYRDELTGKERGDVTLVGPSKTGGRE